MGYKRNSLEWEPTLPLTLRWPLCHSEAHTELGGGYPKALPGGRTPGICHQRRP